MNILTTFPGRFGDLLWSLPTVRAIAETYGEPVDLVISEKYGSLKPLLNLQPYIRQVCVDQAWQVQETAPITPREPPPLTAMMRDGVQVEYDRIFHLGYEGWPAPNLPQDIYMRAASRMAPDQRVHAPLDLKRPWITPPAWAAQLSSQDVVGGFTEEYFEYKVGLWALLREQIQRRAVPQEWINISNGPRWVAEWYTSEPSWEACAAWISRSQVFLGCCSALHVLAVAIGTPVVCVEPNKDRRQKVFWPCGEDQVRPVIGGDGLPTLDARHVWDTVQTVLAERQAAKRVEVQHV